MAALAIGVDALELDVRLTSDRVVVVTHDRGLNPDITRGPDGCWLEQVGPPVNQLTLDDLRRYDVGRIRPGTRYAAEFPEQVPHDGARIPTLAEVFALDPAIRLTIELKTSSDQPGPLLAEAVTACGPHARMIVQSFDWSGLRHLQRHHPAIELAWLTGDNTRDAPASVAAAGGATWAPAHGDLTEARLDEASRLGLRVVPWTVNDPADMARLIAWGVDGLITDRPDLAREVRSGQAHG